jgi:hypothetical protein
VTVPGFRAEQALALALLRVALALRMRGGPRRGSHRAMKRLIAFSVWLTLVFACHDKPPALGPADAVYHVRGQIVAIERSGDDTTARVAHEAIPGFVDRDGKPDTMPAMTMIFALGPGLDRAALAPESQWDLTFELRWNQPPALRIVAVKPLPLGTALALAPQPR